MTTPFALRGHSGYGLDVTADNLIQKHASADGAERLRRQCAKQQNFRSSHPKFRVCEVLQTGEAGGGFYFTMPFYRGDYAPHFISKASPPQLTALAHDLADFVDTIVSESPPVAVPADIVRDKSLQTVSRVMRQWPSPRLDAVCNAHIRALSNFTEFVLPCGKMHGDLTLSNVIFGASQYILIDFLDGYIESPILDIAKLRQETRLAWSSMVSVLPHDRLKYRIAMERIDSILESRFAGHTFVHAFGDLFEVQNLLRVLPYVREPGTAQAIVRRLVTVQESREAME